MTLPAGDAGSPGESLRFPKALRLRTDREYLEVVRTGERTATRHFTIYRDFRGGEGGLVGISAGKRAGGAVQRNRIKRLLRECCRNNRGAFPRGSRTAVVVKQPFPLATLPSVSSELLPAILRRWGMKGVPTP